MQKVITDISQIRDKDITELGSIYKDMIGYEGKSGNYVNIFTQKANPFKENKTWNKADKIRFIEQEVLPFLDERITILQLFNMKN